MRIKQSTLHDEHANGNKIIQNLIINAHVRPIPTILIKQIH